MSNIVAIVGRPNVGKSTFFNRLVGERDAIEDETSGVTRDRHYGKSNWNGKEFSVIDTGGYMHDSGDVFESEIKRQVELAVSEADAILFMVDIHDGITSMDEDVANLLRRSAKPVIAVVNKADNNAIMANYTEFYALGFDAVFPISAKNGSGTGDMLDELAALLPEEGVEELPEIPRIAIVGRPNAGKSSLLNMLTGEDRSIVTPVAGTTRDSIFTRFNKFGFDYMLVDTAGLRKKTKVDDKVEFYSMTRSIKAIENSDVCILVVDATRGFESQDMNILRIINENKKSVVIVMNKWDLVEKSNNTLKEYEEFVRKRLAPQTHIPIIFTSVTEKVRILKVLEKVQEVYNKRSTRIPTSQLNDIMLELLTENPPPMYKGKRVKVKYITQLPLNYPAFVFFCNLPQYVREPYKRFVENKMREFFGFEGCPLILFFREK